MRQFDPLAQRGEDHGVVAHDVATAQRVHAYFARRTLAGETLAPVPQRLRRQLPFLQDDLQQPRGRAARGVFLEAVVHLDHFRVVPGIEDPGGFLGEVEQQIDADGEVDRPHAGHAGRQGTQVQFFIGGVAGRPDDDRLAVGHGECQQCAGGGGRAEINHHVAGADEGRRVVADVDHRADAHAFGVGHRGNRPAHASAGSVEKNGEGHGSHRTSKSSACLSVAKFAADISHRGGRTSGEPMRPASASAALIGAGLVSTNSALNNG